MSSCNNYMFDCASLQTQLMEMTYTAAAYSEWIFPIINISWTIGVLEKLLTQVLSTIGIILKTLAFSSL